MPLEKDSLLNNRYRIEDTIASGGMGAIYRAIDDPLGIAVAVKENFFTTEEFSRQFRREATILAGLRHPNLPRVTDHFVITGQGQYLVMDFIEGSDLRDLISRQGCLAEDEVVRIGVAVCDALEYLHSRKPVIVHRDVKPGNLKITPAGQVFLVDFGLAKISHGEATTIGAQALTPGYAPPEQYGQGTEPRSDLYSLGATLYAALTGKIPEDGLSRVMGSIDLTPIRKYNPQISPAIAQVVEHAMAVQTQDRYQTAGELRQALINAAPGVNLARPVISNGQTAPQRSPAVPVPAVPDVPLSSTLGATVQSARSPIQADPYPPVSAPDGPIPLTPAVPAPGRRKKSLTSVILGLVGLFILAGFGLLFLLPGLRKGTQTSTPPVSTAAAVVPVANDLSPTTTTSQIPSTAPPAAPTATLPPLPTTPPTQAPSPSETVPFVPTGSPAPVETPTGGGQGQIAFSSDRSGNMQIWVADIGSASNATQITRLADGACQPDWSPDGLQLAFVSPCEGKQENYAGSSLYLIHADGTGLMPLSSFPGGDFDPAWSPDGSQIAFTSLRDNGVPHIYLYNLADNTSKRLSRVVNYERQPAWSSDGKWLAYQTTRLGEPQIWIMSPDGENAREFSSLPGSFEWMPVWAPDSSFLVYSQGSPSQLVARQVGDRLAKEVPISDRIRPAEGADFSPDGWWLVFQSQKDGNMDLYLILKNGSNLTKFTDQPGLDFHPSWRPAAKP